MFTILILHFVFCMNEANLILKLTIAISSCVPIPGTSAILDHKI